MSKISRIEMYHVRIPLDTPFYPSWIPGYPQTENRFDLIRVTTKSGVTGYSAGPAISTERKGIGDLIAPYLLDNDATDISLMQQRLREMSYLGIRSHWIEPAFWDIKGKLENKPVYELLGARAVPVELYASTGEVKGPGERVEEVRRRYEEGFRSVKLRVHDFDVREDIRQVEAVAKAFGDKMKIGVDANQGWRVTIVNDAPLWDLKRAGYFSDACADLGVAWIEEPLPMDDYDSLSALAAYSKVPISGGELHSSGLPELRMMIERKCYHIFQPDAVMAGGIGQTMEVIRLCREHNLLYSPHTWTNGIGFAINLQMFIASRFTDRMTLEYPFSPPSWTVEKRDGLLVQPFLHRKGSLTPPTLPGLGFEIDEAQLKKYGRHFFNMSGLGLKLFAVRDKGFKTALEISRNRKRFGVKPSPKI
ncbi:MAG TPA: mandelate racemase/muconate lactonizing enzyme family protein [Deltaproteobacteria bacterium]|nr:mandelate racemase/muconate lactonizing enzyme family protein [Deltaproteobacteria bacterium]HQJ08085.1 mandelate racemase/muconate lactonizing enzyme family protein [Deltaproteobacteria bacterium]